MLQKFINFLKLQTKILLIASIFTFLFIVILATSFKELDATRWSNIGSAFGGLLGPLVAIFSGYLLYLTLSEQRKTNNLVVDSQRHQAVMEEIRLFKENVNGYLYEITKIEKKIINTNAEHISCNYPSYFLKTLDKIIISFDDYKILMSILYEVRIIVDEAHKVSDFSEIPIKKMKHILHYGKFYETINSIRLRLHEHNHSDEKTIKNVNIIVDAINELNKKIEIKSV
jgi:hypothetical protein